MTTWHHLRELDERLEQLESDVRLILRYLSLQITTCSTALSARGKLNMLNVKVGDNNVIFTFKEFDGLAGAGNLVKPSGSINFASDNEAVATVDSTKQTLNADGSVTVPILPVSAGVANITGVDPTSTNKVAAGDVLTVATAPPPPPPPPLPALSATGTLSVSTSTGV
jgi:hypothetical protein